MVISHREHIHIVVVSAAGISREIEILADNISYGVPHGAYVAAYSPRIGDTAHPCAGIAPSADVEVHFLARYAVDNIAYGGVSCLFVEFQFLTAAVVNLDEIEVPICKISSGISHIVAIHAGAYAVNIFIVG